MEATDDISTGVSNSDVWVHIRATERAARRCQLLLEEYQRCPTEDLRTELSNQCLVTIRMSVAALSAWASVSDDNDVEELREFLVPRPDTLTASEACAVIQSKVTEVRGRVLFVSPGIAANSSTRIKGYRYTAHRDDLSSEIILDEALTCYEWAYQWFESLPDRAHQTALAGSFTFSTGEQANSGALGEFCVKW